MVMQAQIFSSGGGGHPDMDMSTPHPYGMRLAARVKEVLTHLGQRAVDDDALGQRTRTLRTDRVAGQVEHGE